MQTSIIHAEHPLLQVALNDKGVLVDIGTPAASRYCPSCLQPVEIAASGKLVHSPVDSSHTCKPSIEAVVTKALLRKLNDCEKVYVNPVSEGRRAVVPALIIKPSTSSASEFINNKYQPTGISWRSAKGFRMGMFILPNKAASVNKSHYDFIAAINPDAFLDAFNIALLASPERTTLSVLYELLVNPNSFSEWVRWPVQESRTEQASVAQGNWYEYYDADAGRPAELACTASVTGIEGNDASENIYILQVLLDGHQDEYQIVRSMGSVILLDYAGNALPAGQHHYELIRLACIAAVKSFVRQNQIQPQFRALFVMQ